MIKNDALNEQAIAIEEAETEIRKIVKEQHLKGASNITTSALIKRVIKDCRDKLKSPVLKSSATRSLTNFYKEQAFSIRLISKDVLVTSLILSKGKSPTPAETRVLDKQGITVRGGMVLAPDTPNYGVPMQKYSKDYFRQNVKPVYDRLMAQTPKDTNDIKGRNTLRNLAEMEVRYEAHQKEIDGFKEKGVKLVIASTHADCSKRCAKWQGKVYSLDGSTGKTDDGRKYIPLEVATDNNQVYYTNPKTGTQYRGGLLGYNCRHFLVEYKTGYSFPKPNAQEEKKQYAITQKQRALERQVREWKTKAVYLKNVNREEYLKARKKAIDLNKDYIAFSKKHGRAYYPSRTQLI